MQNKSKRTERNKKYGNAHVRNEFNKNDRRQ